MSLWGRLVESSLVVVGDVDADADSDVVVGGEVDKRSSGTKEGK